MLTRSAYADRFSGFRHGFLLTRLGSARRILQHKSALPAETSADRAVSDENAGSAKVAGRPAASERGAASSTDMPFKPPEPAPVTGRAPTDADLGGMLAGRIIDSYNNR